MPIYDESSPEVIRRTVICERCLEPGLYRLDVHSGRFSFECSCCQLEACEIHTLRGPGELRAVHFPGNVRALRPSSRILSSARGRVFRQLWSCSAGSILQSNADFVAVHSTEGGRTTWHREFAAAFFDLTGEIWKDDPQV